MKPLPRVFLDNESAVCKGMNDVMFRVKCHWIQGVSGSEGSIFRIHQLRWLCAVFSNDSGDRFEID